MIPAYFAASFHQPSVSALPTFGCDGTSRNGVAPHPAIVFRILMTFARYWIVFADHGDGAVGCSRSLSPIHGVGQAMSLTAWSTSLFAAASTVVGSAGLAGVPARRGRFSSQYTVAAPPARSAAETFGPAVAATIPGCAKTSLRNETEPCAYSSQTG